MAYNYEYPYTDPYRYNADWLLNTVKAIAEEWKKVESDWSDLRDFVENFFETLDLTDEVEEILNKWLDDGTIESIISMYVNHLQTYEQIIESTVDYPSGTRFMIIFGTDAFPMIVTDTEESISYPLKNGKFITYRIGQKDEIKVTVLKGFPDLSDKMQALLNAGYVNFYISQGLYTLSLSLPQYTHIRGDAAHTSITSKNGTYIFKLNGDNISLSDMYLFGAKESGISALKSDIASGSSFSEFRNLHFNGMNIHMELQGSHIWCRFDGCRMESAAYASMYVTGTNTTFFNNNSFMNCRFNNNNMPVNIDLQAINCFSVSFYSCNFEYNATSFFISGSCAFYGCYFEGNTGLVLRVPRTALFSGTCFINESDLINTELTLAKKTFISCWSYNSTNIFDNAENVEKIGCNF